MTPDFETFKARWYTKYDVAINDPHLMDRGYLAVAALRDGWNEAAAASEQRIADVTTALGVLRDLMSIEEQAGSWTDRQARDAWDARVTKAHRAACEAMDAFFGSDVSEVMFWSVSSAYCALPAKAFTAGQTRSVEETNAMLRHCLEFNAKSHFETKARLEQRIAELEAEHGPGKCVCAEPALDAMEKYDARVAELEAALGRVQDARDHIAFNIGRARLDFGDVDLYDEILNGLDAALAVPTSVPSVQRQEGERE